MAVVVVDMHHFHDETLSTGAVGVGAADEVEETRTIKVKRAVSIVKRCDGIAGVAVVETPFVHFHHRVLVVHKRERIADVEAVDARPAAVNRCIILEWNSPLELVSNLENSRTL